MACQRGAYGSPQCFHIFKIVACQRVYDDDPSPNRVGDFICKPAIELWLNKDHAHLFVTGLVNYTRELPSAG